jgi:hypothetical protein
MSAQQRQRADTFLCALGIVSMTLLMIVDKVTASVGAPVIVACAMRGTAILGLLMGRGIPMPMLHGEEGPGAGHYRSIASSSARIDHLEQLMSDLSRKLGDGEGKGGGES